MYFSVHGLVNLCNFADFLLFRHVNGKNTFHTALNQRHPLAFGTVYGITYCTLQTRVNTRNHEASKIKGNAPDCHAKKMTDSNQAPPQPTINFVGSCCRWFATWMAYYHGLAFEGRQRYNKYRILKNYKGKKIQPRTYFSVQYVQYRV
jgi:hypothetical protein